jgi:hypothetical protein
MITEKEPRPNAGRRIDWTYQPFLERIDHVTFKSQSTYRIITAPYQPFLEEKLVDCNIDLVFSPIPGNDLYLVAVRDRAHSAHTLLTLQINSRTPD